MTDEEEAEPPVEEPPAMTTLQPTEPITPKPEESDSLILKANEAATRLEEANKKFEGLLARQEQQHVENTLGGTASAGRQALSPEEKSVASAKKLLEGTGFEDMFDPPEKKT